MSKLGKEIIDGLNDLNNVIDNKKPSAKNLRVSLSKLRQKIVESGQKLFDWDDLEKEVKSRR